MQDNLENIRQLPREILKNLDKLIVNRQGCNQQSMMITRDILGCIYPRKCYQLNWNVSNKNRRFCLVETPKTDETFPLNNTIKNTFPPKHVVISGKWIQEDLVFKPDANILGGMGSFILKDEQDVIVPVIEATPQNLSFYNAYILSIGSKIQFESNHSLPVVSISIGENYVDHFLSQEKYGGGEYIEYHDQPHLWAPKSPGCTGHILLGRQDNDKLYLTGFRIPFSKAIYISPLTLHSDAYLVGDYLVVYSVTENFSTVLFKKRDGEMLRLKFIFSSVY